MKATRLLFTFLFVAALISNCKAQNNDLHPCAKEAFCTDKEIASYGIGEADSQEIAEEYATIQAESDLYYTVLASMYPEVLNALNSAINNAPKNNSSYTKGVKNESDGKTVYESCCVIRVSREELQRNFEEALLKSEFFKDLIEKHSITTRQNTIND